MPTTRAARIAHREIGVSDAMMVRVRRGVGTIVHAVTDGGRPARPVPKGRVRSAAPPEIAGVAIAAEAHETTSDTALARMRAHQRHCRRCK